MTKIYGVRGGELSVNQILSAYMTVYIKSGFLSTPTPHEPAYFTGCCPASSAYSHGDSSPASMWTQVLSANIPMRNAYLILKWHDFVYFHLHIINLYPSYMRTLNILLPTCILDVFPLSCPGGHCTVSTIALCWLAVFWSIS